MKGLLVVEDGSTYLGNGFGWIGKKKGELVFSTAMVGYQECLTDPSYAGQILVMGYPLIGNYGILEDVSESEKVYVEAYVIRDVSDYSWHRKSVNTLSEYLAHYHVPGVYGLDTRELVLKIREQGVMRALVVTYEDTDYVNPNELLEELIGFSYETVDYVKAVEKKVVTQYGKGKKELVLVDCGCKFGIVREFVERNCKVIVVPASTSSAEIREIDPDGVVYSNGPGNPALLDYVYAGLRDLAKDYPVFGVCLGNQLVAHAFGAKTYKLRFGHRGINQPVIDLRTEKLYITTHNHGYAVDEKTLPKELEVWFVNKNDNSVEGLVHKELPIMSVQFHPEARPGTWDTKFLFDEFLRNV